jgi:predicted nucleic acid-binding protein
MPVWDTSVASGLHPQSQLFEFAAGRAVDGQPILLAAATVAEIYYGLERNAGDQRFADALVWFNEILRAGVVGVLPLTREGAQLAGLLRAIHPVPPPAPKRDKRSKPDRRVAWFNDIQIAASAWLRAEPLCTQDQGHFRVLAKAITERYPGAGELELISSPI